MTDMQSNFGIQSTGEAINWRSINEKHNDDPVISELMTEAMLFIKNDVSVSIHEDKVELNNLLEKFNIFLTEKKIPTIFTVTTTVKAVESKSKGKQKKQTSKELLLQKIRDENEKKEADRFIKSINLTEYHPNSSNNIKEAFLIIVYWALVLLKKKKDSTINMQIYINCAISLYRAIQDSLSFLTEDMIIKSNELLVDLENIIQLKIGNTSLLNVVSLNLNLLSNSYWDKEKPKAIALYDEQKTVISTLLTKLERDESLLLFYKVPPANGKTVLSAILAKSIVNINQKNMHVDGYKNKVLLYICYNSIVREEVANLCTTHDVDIKYWFARTQLDNVDGKIKTLLRPYKTCYPDWNKKVFRNKKEEEEFRSNKAKRYSEDLNVQWEYFLNETRRLSEQTKEIKNYKKAPNTPEMIISDLDSALKLLQEFPDIFIPYFDEAFAASSLKITSKILKALPKVSILISATLADPEELPVFIDDFKVRHNLVDDTFLHLIKSDTQHISCTFIDNNGYMFAPHNSIKNLGAMPDFLELLKKEPLLKRAYSPEIVFNMSERINTLLPLDMKFKENFPFIGMITHASLRNYAIKILNFIHTSQDIGLLNILNENLVRKITDLSISNMFTTNTIHYQSAKTLHVSSSSNFNSHVNDIALPFLEGSPKISDVISQYNREHERLKLQLENLEKNGNKDSEYEKQKINKEVDDIRLAWPSEFILNSKTHAGKFGNLKKILMPNNEIFGKIDEIDSLDELQSKLYFSGVGVYQPESFTNSKMSLFLRNKDKYKFILSTPSIVYGTNISLSIIDIDSSFSPETTKNMLYQLIGRAGRKGKSDSATIIFRDQNMIQKILEHESINIEAVQIESDYQELLN